jgi:glycosyltransferase involved in cell wall biosynthesis
LIVNQWATGRKSRESAKGYLSIASLNDLSLAEFNFLSEISNEYTQGIDRRVLLELMQLGNLFVFPTVGESFGLVPMEAALASGCLTIINSELDEMQEIHGGFTELLRLTNKTKVDLGISRPELVSIADCILANMDSPSIKHRTYIRKNFNMDAIYKKHYAKLIDT